MHTSQCWHKVQVGGVDHVKEQSAVQSSKWITHQEPWERMLAAYNDQWQPFRIEAQVAEVSTPLASVYQMCKSGNKVIFDERGGMVINKVSGKIMPIEVNNGAYEINMWVPAVKDKEGSTTTSRWIS